MSIWRVTIFSGVDEEDGETTRFSCVELLCDAFKTKEAFPGELDVPLTSWRNSDAIFCGTDELAVVLMISTVPGTASSSYIDLLGGPETR